MADLLVRLPKLSAITPNSLEVLHSPTLQIILTSCLILYYLRQADQNPKVCQIGRVAAVLGAGISIGCPYSIAVHLDLNSNLAQYLLGLCIITGISTCALVLDLANNQDFKKGGKLLFVLSFYFSYYCFAVLTLNVVIKTDFGLLEFTWLWLKTSLILGSIWMTGAELVQVKGYVLADIRRLKSRKLTQPLYRTPGTLSTLRLIGLGLFLCYVKMNNPPLYFNELLILSLTTGFSLSVSYTRRRRRLRVLRMEVSCWLAIYLSIKCWYFIADFVSTPANKPS
jgi:hypothetical protein